MFRGIEFIRYVNPCLVVQPFEHVLIRVRVVQRAFHFYEPTDFDIIKIVPCKVTVYFVLAGIPCDFQFGIFLSHISCQPVDLLLVPVAAHETNTSYVAIVLRYVLVESTLVQHFAGIFPQVFAVAIRTMVGAIRYAYRKAYFVRNLLEYYVDVDIFKHFRFFVFQRLVYIHSETMYKNPANRFFLHYYMHLYIFF